MTKDLRVTIAKQYLFSVYFNFKNFKDKVAGREWAERTRENSLTYLERLFENKSQFSCTARDEAKDCLMLRGFVNLNSPCTQAYMKQQMLGKFSSCKPSFFGDMVSLCRFLHVDRNLVVTGRLPHGRKNSVKKLYSFTGDPKFVVKILLDSIDKKDVEQLKEPALVLSLK